MAAPKPKPPSLRDHLQSSLSNLPNSSELRVYTLISHPRRTKDLFPHTPNHPRCFQVDYLVLCGAVLPSPRAPAEPPTSNPIPSAEGDNAASDSSTDPTAPALTQEQSKEEKFVYTSAISAHLYILPHSSSALLYISKVDSSTHGPALALTRTLITSFLSFHLLPSSRPAPETRIHLFARSQGQYLFPNSADGGKKNLGGLKLCGWWKGVYEDAAREVKRLSSASSLGTSGENGDIGKEGRGLGELRLEYLLPSYSAIEAAGLLGLPKRPLPDGLSWKYTPPFSTPLAPTSSSSSSNTSLATLIPSLPDDPKTRFLDELVDSEPYHPSSAPPPEDDDAPENVLLSPRKKRKIQEAKSDEHERTHSATVLAKTTREEFWERMGFRQEMAIDVTGFFGLSVGPPPSASSPRTTTNGNSTSTSSEAKHMADPTGTPGAISHQIVERLHQALLNTDFANLSLAIEGSAHWTKTARTMVIDEIGTAGWDLNVGVVPAKEGITPAERVEKRKEEAPVTMLQVRKKKKV